MTTAASLPGSQDDSHRRLPTRSVVLCAVPRSGSWLLSEALWRTGMAGRPEEYFRPDWRQRFAATGALRFEHRLHQQQPWQGSLAAVGGPATAAAGADGSSRPRLDAFLQEVMSIGTTPNGVFSVKVHWFQLVEVLSRLGQPGQADEPPPMDLLFPSPTYVRLVREDKVRQAISWYRAIATNDWWRRPDAPARPRQAAYDDDELDRLQYWLDRQERSWDAYLERCGVRPITVTYRELRTDYRHTVATLLERLGLPSEQTRIDPPRLARQADALTDAWVARRTARGRSATPAGPTAHLPENRVTPRRSEMREATAMRTSTILVDNFYANPGAVRQFALKQRYYHPYQSAADDANGRPPAWMASRFKPADACPFKSSLELLARLEEVTGDCIDLDHWNRGFPVDASSRPLPAARRTGPTSALWNCCFHLKTGTGSALSEGVHNHVTDDWNTVGEDGWSGLVYLTDDPPLRGGLQTWRNVHPEHDYDWMTPTDQWELVDDLANVPNRLVLFRGSVPHSGAPGWGASLEDGRLFQTFFFRVQPRRPPEGVLAPV